MRTVHFTSESVTAGHPDKLCDCISDAVLDAALTLSPGARVACETLAKTGMIVLAGEITCDGHPDYPAIVRRKVREIGYTSSEIGFDGGTCAVLVAVEGQSSDISQGVTEGQGLYKAQGAGDQGMMFGFACDETREKMPAPIMYAHKLTAALTQARRKGQIPYLRPDGKAQVTVAYRDGRPAHIDTVVVSTQHAPDVSRARIRKDVIEGIIMATLPASMLNSTTKYLVNPTGSFVTGGPQGDCGLTGRKIIVDTYGGMGRHGGGAFSGKDPSKVDRSAAYMARYIAKNIVAARLARRCEVQLAYAIGYPEPVSILVETFGTGTVEDARIEKAIPRVFALQPARIIEALDLLRPRYQLTAENGHFGRNSKLDVFTWERTDRGDELRAAL